VLRDEVVCKMEKEPERARKRKKQKRNEAQIYYLRTICAPHVT